MRAYVLTENGPCFVDREAVEPGTQECRVRVKSCGLNRVDLAMAGGHRHGRAGGAGATLGVEWAGEVEAVGPEVTEVAIGDRVMASGAGAFAESVLGDAGRMLPVPPAMSWEEAASLPVALQTMHDAVVTNGQMTSGDAVLVQGASSGVGLMALRIARYRKARCVVGSSRDAERRRELEAYADLVVDPSDKGWVQEVLDATEGHGVDLVIDQVSGPQFRQCLEVTRIGGRLVNVGRLGGQRAEFDFDLHALRRLTYVGVTFRTRSRQEVREIVRRVRADLWEALLRGELALPIDRVYPFEEIEDALARMRRNEHFGKIVLRL